MFLKRSDESVCRKVHDCPAHPKNQIPHGVLEAPLNVSAKVLVRRELSKLPEERDRTGRAERKEVQGVLRRAAKQTTGNPAGVANKECGSGSTQEVHGRVNVRLVTKHASQERMQNEHS